MRQVLVPERRRDCHPPAQQALWQLRSVDELDGVPQLGPLRVTGVRIGRENLARQIHTSVPVVPPADNLAIHEARPQGMGVLGAALEQMDDGPGHPLQVLGWVARGPRQIVVYRTGDSAAEQIDVDATRLALPVEGGHTVEVFPQSLEQLARRQEGVQAPVVRCVERFLGPLVGNGGR